MVSRSILYRLMSNRTLLGGWAVLFLLWLQSPLLAQVARLNWDHSGVSTAQDISLSADSVSSWTEADREVVLLKGNVSIKQGLILCRMQNALVLVDTAAQTKTGSYALEIYGEVDASVLDGSNNVTGGKTLSQVLFSLSTRSEVKANAFGGKAGARAVAADRRSGVSTRPHRPREPTTEVPGAGRGRRRTRRRSGRAR